MVITVMVAEAREAVTRKIIYLVCSTKCSVTSGSHGYLLINTIFQTQYYNASDVKFSLGRLDEILNK